MATVPALAVGVAAAIAAGCSGADDSAAARAEASRDRAAVAGCPTPRTQPTRIPSGPTYRPSQVRKAPFTTGPYWGRTAVLHVDRYEPPAFDAKLWWFLPRRGIERLEIDVARVSDGAPGRMWNVPPAPGRPRWTRVLRVEVAEIAAAYGLGSGRERRLGVHFMAGAVRLPSEGCYRLRARWPEGEWTMSFDAREGVAQAGPASSRRMATASATTSATISAAGGEPVARPAA